MTFEMTLNISYDTDCNITENVNALSCDIDDLWLRVMVNVDIAETIHGAPKLSYGMNVHQEWFDISKRCEIK